MTERVEPIGAGDNETPERDGAFPRLDDGQRRRLRSMGRVREVEAGEVLFRAGDESSDFFVVESGAVTIVQGLGEENHVIAIHGEGRFLGELSLLIGQRLYLSGVVRDAGEVIQIPLSKLREIIDEDRTLSDVILGAFMARRSMLIDVGTGLKLIGSRFSPDSRRLRELLARNRMPYQWIDLDRDEHADALLTELSIEPSETPVAVTGGGEVLRNPDNAELGTRYRPRILGIAAPPLRRGRRGSRARRARSRPLCGIGGPRCPGGGGGRLRRAGGHVRADRELPRLSRRSLGKRADPAGDHPGGQVRRPIERPRRRGGAAQRARAARNRALERRDGQPAGP